MSNTLRSNTILIVEDDVIFARQLGDYLSEQGAEVIVAQDGEQGYKLAASEPLDLLITDLTLPRKSGESMIQQLRQQGHSLPIIVITEGIQLVDAASVLRLGVQDLLLKPILDFSTVRVAILQVLYPSLFSSEVAEDELFQAELQHVTHTPEAASTLLQQLQPPVKQMIGGCELLYRQLTDSTDYGLVCDTAELSADQLAFYVADTALSPEHGLMVALLFRTVFDSYVQNNKGQTPPFSEMMNNINQLVRGANIVGQFPLLMGYFHRKEQKLVFCPAGLHSVIVQEGQQRTIDPGMTLGTTRNLNILSYEIDFREGECRIWGVGGQVQLRITPQS